MRGELKWLQLHIKREQAQEREPKRFRRELIVCAVVAVGATILTLVTTLVLGNILREIAIETFETLRSGGPSERLKKSAGNSMSKDEQARNYHRSSGGRN